MPRHPRGNSRIFKEIRINSMAPRRAGTHKSAITVCFIADKKVPDSWLWGKVGLHTHFFPNIGTVTDKIFGPNDYNLTRFRELCPEVKTGPDGLGRHA